MSEFAAWFRSVVHLIVFYGGSVPVVLFNFACVPFGQNAVIFGSRRWGRWHLWCARWILGIKLQIDGELPQGSAFCIMKHESFFEAAVTLAVFDRPIVVMKEELRNVPVWGRCSNAHGSIWVNREAGAAAMRRMIGAAKVARESGRPVVLFPEGTRVLHGETPPLRAGFAGLYKMLDLPVVPVALDSGRLWKPNGFIKRSGTVRFVVGEVIPPGLARDEAEGRAHAAINVLAQSV